MPKLMERFGVTVENGGAAAVAARDVAGGRALLGSVARVCLGSRKARRLG